MTRFPALIVLGAAALLGACTDLAGPKPGDPVLKTVDPGASIPDDSIHILRQGPTAPPLGTLDTAVWVVKGRRQTIRVRYESTTLPDSLLGFLELNFHDSTLSAFPDGTPMLAGDSVRITISVDPVQLRWNLGPDGLVFNRPARLKIRYTFADADYNDDGMVDGLDEAIRVNKLSLRVLVGGLWEGVPANHDLLQDKFDGELKHFTNYAVAW